ncbi:MAG: alpha/beta fold hydrolase [Dermatophilaceae bacterium]
MVEQVRPEVDHPDPAWAAVVRAVSVPTLVIAGGPRSFVPSAHVTELAGSMQDARLVTLDTGHDVHEVDPDGFVGALVEFLDDPKR